MATNSGREVLEKVKYGIGLTAGFVIGFTKGIVKGIFDAVRESFK